MPKAPAKTERDNAPVGGEGELELEQPATPKATKKAPKPSLLSQATPLDEKEEFVNALWVGDSGTGKTTAVAHMANLGPTIFINAEGGLKRGPLKRMGVDVTNIQVLPADANELSYSYLEDLYWELAARLAEDPDAIAGIVWDSITEIHQKVLRNVVDYQLKRAESRGESRIKNAVAGDMLNEFFTDMGDYGVMTEQMRLLLRRYRDLPCHFAVTALERRDTDDDGRVVYRAAVTPALAKDLHGYMDITAVTSVMEVDDGGDDDEYVALTRPIGKYRGKDRFKVLPKRMVNPTFDRVVRYVAGSLDEDNDSEIERVRARIAAAKA